MIIYSSSQVMSNTLPQKNINLPTTVKSIQFRNVSAWSFHIVSSNSEWDILPFSSTIFPVSGNQNLSIIPLTQITFTDINIPLGVSLDYMTQPIASVSSYSLLPIFTGNVNAVIQSGTVNANITNSNLPISGSVDATIQNATLSTNSTVLNEQLQVGGGYTASGSLTFAASDTTAQQITLTLTKDYVLVGAKFSIALVSQSGNYYAYNINFQRIVNIGGQQLPKDNNVTSSTPSVMPNPVYEYSPSENPNPWVYASTYPLTTFNQIVLQLTPAQSETNADTVTIYVVAEGQPADAVNIVYEGPTSQTQSVSTTTPFPVGLQSNGLVNFVSAGSIGSNATVDLGISPKNIYRIYAWTNGPGVLRLLAGTAWLAHFESSWMVLDLFPNPYGNGGNAMTLYNTDTTTQYYTIWVQYD